MKFLALLLLFVVTLAPARDPAQVRAFRQQNPCPATGRTTGACPGHVTDHIMPLCIGGPDLPRNMQWQAKAESYRKDVLEREICRLHNQPHQGD